VEGTSLETQKAACLQYAEASGLKVQSVFEEEGESAKFRDRTELLKLLEYCRNEKNIKALIVWKVDRFARNVEDHFAVKRELLKYGVAIHSVTEPISDSPIGRFTETIFAAMAECDNGIRAHRCIEGMQHKIQNGIFPWKPPLGYLTINQRGEKKNKPDIRDPKRFAIIQEAWKLLLSGSFQKADVVRYFRSRGLTASSGKWVSAQVVDFMFQNKFYAGILHDPWGNKEYPGLHEGMVTPEEFDAVQVILNPRSRRIIHVTESPDFHLRGLVRCRACLRPMTGSWSTGRSKRYAYYHCYSPVCSRYGKGIARETLEGQFVGILEQYAIRPRLVPLLVQKLRRESTAARRKCDLQTASYRVRLSVLEKEDQELIQMRRRNLICDEEFSQDHVRLSDDICKVRELLNNLQTERFDEKDVAEVLSFLASLRTNWPRTAFHFRRRFQQAVFCDGLIDGKFGTAKKSDVFRFIDGFQNRKTMGVHPTLEFWNRVIRDFVKLAKLIRSPDVFAKDEKSLIPNTNGNIPELPMAA
jgi:site-specific DNA recombinase